MAQTVSRQPLTAVDRVRSRISPREICVGQSGVGTGFPQCISVFPCQSHSTGAPLQGKTKKLIIFITWLHNKPQGCGASVASAAGPFTTHTHKKVLSHVGCDVVSGNCPPSNTASHPRRLESSATSLREAQILHTIGLFFV